MSLVPGQGHFGPDAIPGVSSSRIPTTALFPSLHVHYTTATALPWQDARWRRGESVSLKTARDTMVPLELAQHAQMVYAKA
jgi:hypothetical protein